MSETTTTFERHFCPCCREIATGELAHSSHSSSVSDTSSEQVQFCDAHTTLQYLRGTKLAIDAFVDMLKSSPPLPHRTPSDFKLCPHKFCATCLALDVQLILQPELTYVPQSLKHRALLRLVYSLASKADWSNAIESLSTLTETHKKEVKDAVESLLNWYQTHLQLLGLSIVCLLPKLHWKNITEVDSLQTAKLIVQARGLSPDIKWLIGTAYNLDEANESWSHFDAELRAHFNTVRPLVQKCLKQKTPEVPPKFQDARTSNSTSNNGAASTSKKSFGNVVLLR